MAVRSAWRSTPPPRGKPASAAARAQRRFRRHFPGRFRDPTYLDWEREYKCDTHARWVAALGRERFAGLLREGRHAEIAALALRVEQQSRHSMIFSFEKMALRDAVRTTAGAERFARGLYAFLHGEDPLEQRFGAWVETVDSLPRRQTRVLTWPIVTVFGFIAQPGEHLFVKPTVVRTAAERYGFPLAYRSRPSWETYRSVLAFAGQIRRDLAAWRPRDMIDLQSFIWVLGSTEYD